MSLQGNKNNHAEFVWDEDDIINNLRLKSNLTWKEVVLDAAVKHKIIKASDQRRYIESNNTEEVKNVFTKTFSSICKKRDSLYIKVGPHNIVQFIGLKKRDGFSDKIMLQTSYETSEGSPYKSKYIYLSGNGLLEDTLKQYKELNEDNSKKTDILDIMILEEILRQID